MRASDVAVAVLILVGLVAASLYLATPPVRVSGGVRVIDGDTIKLAGHTIRFADMDAPELAQTCQIAGAAQRCGEFARTRLVALVAGATTTCHLVGTDRYRRDLGHCDVAGQDLGGTLVSEGLAVAYGGYAREEREAREARRGLWAGTFERPSEWRKAHPRTGLYEALP